jgi:hypothetical protein
MRQPRQLQRKLQALPQLKPKLELPLKAQLQDNKLQVLLKHQPVLTHLMRQPQQGQHKQQALLQLKLKLELPLKVQL